MVHKVSHLKCHCVVVFYLFRSQTHYAISFFFVYDDNLFFILFKSKFYHHFNRESIYLFICEFIYLYIYIFCIFILH